MFSNHWFRANLHSLPTGNLWITIRIAYLPIELFSGFPKWWSVDPFSSPQPPRIVRTAEIWAWHEQNYTNMQLRKVRSPYKYMAICFSANAKSSIILPSMPRRQGCCNFKNNTDLSSDPLDSSEDDKTLCFSWVPWLGLNLFYTSWVIIVFLYMKVWGRFGPANKDRDSLHGHTNQWPVLLRQWRWMGAKPTRMRRESKLDLALPVTGQTPLDRGQSIAWEKATNIRWQMGRLLHDPMKPLSLSLSLLFCSTSIRKCRERC